MTSVHYLHGLNIVKINSERLILLEELDTYKYKIVDIKHDFWINPVNRNAPKISYFRTSTSQCFVFLESFDTRHMGSHISEKIRLARIQTFGPILL